MRVELQTVLKRELKNRHLTINGLAKSCKIPISVLHGWVNGVLPSAKNLHHVAVLSKYFGLPVSVLLFNKTENSTEATVLFNSEFADGEHQYRLSIVKVKKDD